jgi:cell division protein WhiA
VSFTAEVKDELSHWETDCRGCKRAELSALIRIEGRLSANYRLEVTTETAAVARCTVRLMHELYRLKTEITTRRSILHKSYNYLIVVPAQIGLKEALVDLGILSEEGIELGVAPQLVRRDCCGAAYLRGAFLGGGFIADPRGDFHFELTTGHEELATGLVDIMQERGIAARMVRRRNVFIVYLKGADAIIDFLGAVGAYRSVLAMENVRVTKSVRNDVNRRLNAEIANQQKSIDASFSQIQAIQTIEAARGLDSLPPALKELAILRLEHPDVTLRELGELADPPLSKSAINHRIRRLEAIAEEIAR